MRGGIRHREADRLKREIEAADLDAVRRQITEEELEAARDRRRPDGASGAVPGLARTVPQWVGFESAPFRQALSCALELLGAEPLARSVDSHSGGRERATWTFPALDRRTGADPTWAATLDTLCPPRRAAGKSARDPHRRAGWQPSGLGTPDGSGRWWWGARVTISRRRRQLSDSLSERLLIEIGNAETLYHRLVLVVAPSGSGKTAALRDVARRTGVQPLNLNLELSRRMIDLTARQRALQLPRALEDIAGRDAPLRAA